MNAVYIIAGSIFLAVFILLCYVAIRFNKEKGQGTNSVPQSYNPNRPYVTDRPSATYDTNRYYTDIPPGYAPYNRPSSPSYPISSPSSGGGMDFVEGAIVGVAADEILRSDVFDNSSDNDHSSPDVDTSNSSTDDFSGSGSSVDTSFNSSDYGSSSSDSGSSFDSSSSDSGSFSSDF